MATVGELTKNREIYSIQGNNTVQEAASYMSHRNVGSLPVLRGGKLVGVLSERDIVRRVLMAGRDWKTTRVDEIMSDDPLTVSSQVDVEHCMLLMKQHGFRHLPVVDSGILVGFISMRDLLLHEVDEKELEMRMMRAYMSNG